jgi:hypothetical protein
MNKFILKIKYLVWVNVQAIKDICKKCTHYIEFDYDPNQKNKTGDYRLMKYRCILCDRNFLRKDRKKVFMSARDISDLKRDQLRHKWSRDKS